MFTGIIEATGTVNSVDSGGSNKTFWIESPLSPAFKPDQSVSHNGVCLTVEATKGSMHKVTAIAETLQKTNLDEWKPGTVINLERSLEVGSRLDGHFVQGHVDTTGICTDRKEREGSTEFRIEFPAKFAGLLIEKGSISLNGVSLTAFHVKKKSFTVAIIPYTLEHTNIRFIQPGDTVNLEFDILGKYLLRRLSLKAK